MKKWKQFDERFQKLNGIWKNYAQIFLDKIDTAKLMEGSKQWALKQLEACDIEDLYASLQELLTNRENELTPNTTVSTIFSSDPRIEICKTIQKEMTNALSKLRNLQTEQLEKLSSEETNISLTSRGSSLNF